MGCACNHNDINSEKINEMQENNNSFNESKTNNAIQNNFIIIQDSNQNISDVNKINLKNSTILIQNSNNENEQNFNLLQNPKPSTFKKEEINERNRDINKDIKDNNNFGIINATPNSNYQEIETDKIPDSEFNEMLIQYPLIEQYIMENGMLIIMYDTEEEFKYGKMVLNMQDIGKTTEQMGKENYIMLMEIYMKEIG